MILSMIVGGFWLLDSLKDPIFATIVGIEYQPTAKLLSVAFTLVVVSIYDYLTSLVSRPVLFYIVGGSYGVTFLVLSGLLPPAEMHNGATLRYSQWLGWMSYFVIESYGSLMVAMFWSFTNSIMDLEEAKGGYGLMLSVAQIGAIIGSTLAANVETVGYPMLFLIGAMSVLSVPLQIKLYYIIFCDRRTESVRARVRTWTDDDLGEAETDGALRSAERAEGKPLSSGGEDKTLWKKASNMCFRAFGGFWEGLALISKHKYVMRILAVSCFYEIVVTVLDYEFKMLGAGSLEPSHESDKNASDSFKFAHLMGYFGYVLSD
jgi:AAA family ATP:ADP antiporter